MINETKSVLTSMLDLAGVEPGEADDQDVIRQLRCTLHWAPSDATEALGSGVLWSFGTPLDEFFAEALSLPGWAWALAGVQVPRHLTIELDQI